MAQRSKSDPGPVHAGFVVHIAAMTRVSLRLLHFSCVRNITPTLRTHTAFIYHRRYVFLATDSIVE